jgi:clan AA aspartic protease (TIGR02281 family)
MAAYVLIEEAHDQRSVARSIIVTALTAAAIGLLLLRHLPVAGDPGHRLVVTGDAHGQCHVAAKINDTLFRHLLIDSGASGHLIFGRNHAAELGFPSDRLSFTHNYGSANGVGHEALVRVREFRLDSFVLHDVPAEITDAPQSEPLLGTEILHRLNLQLKNGNCELSWP